MYKIHNLVEIWFWPDFKQSLKGGESGRPLSHQHGKNNTEHTEGLEV